MLTKKQLWARLSKAAFIAALIHFVAGLFMALVLRQGLDTVPLTDRLAFLANHSDWWTIGWLSWNLAALAILYFYYCFAEAHKDDDASSFILHFAVLLTVTGMALDFFAEAIEVGVLPNLAQMSLVHSGTTSFSFTEMFIVLHRLAVMATGCFSNELYTLSAALLIYASRHKYNWFVKGLGCVLVIAGFWLSIACLLSSTTGMFLANVILLPALILWLLSIAYVNWKSTLN